MASREGSIWRPSAAVSLHVLATVKTLGANELDMTVRVVPMSGVAMARNEEPCCDQIRGILGVGVESARTRASGMANRAWARAAGW